jgi:hypothetical protein
VAVVVPRAADVEVWLESGARLTATVLGSTRDARWCRPHHGKIRCVVWLGVPQGVWTASVAKRSAAPAAIEITVTFTPA